jgi:hypothetical protein
MSKTRQTLCVNCHNQFTVEGHAWNKKYCSDKCEKEYRGYQGAYRGMATSTVGTIAELMVAIDLFKRGYSIFKALSPSCFCDLLAAKNGKILKIEVKTGYRNNKGDYGYGRARLEKRENYDILAIVVHSNNEINYLVGLELLE